MDSDIQTMTAELAAMRSELANLQIDVMSRGGSKDASPRWYSLAPGGDGLDLSKAGLGYKINPDGDNPDVVRIYAGEIDRIAVAQTDLHPMLNNYYAYVRRTIADNTMYVAMAASVPANDATYLYYRLYRFTLTDNVASILGIYRPFDIETGSGASDEITIVTDVRYDATTKQLQKKTRLVKVTFKSGASESGWTLISGGQAEECP